MSQKIMALDVEFNQPSKKCIEIGAAVYHVRSAACYETFHTYVNPDETIAPYITELTGIKDQDVQAAPNIKEAYFMLKEFHKKHKVFRNPVLWGSGVRNDSLAIWEESGVTEDNFMGWRVIDAKTLYVSLQLFEDDKYAGGLSESMKRMGLTFEGIKHTALADAQNTFRIWYHLTRKIHDGHKLKK